MKLTPVELFIEVDVLMLVTPEVDSPVVTGLLTDTGITAVLDTVSDVVAGTEMDCGMVNVVLMACPVAANTAAETGMEVTPEVDSLVVAGAEIATCITSTGLAVSPVATAKLAGTVYVEPGVSKVSLVVAAIWKATGIRLAAETTKPLLTTADILAE